MVGHAASWLMSQDSQVFYLGNDDDPLVMKVNKDRGDGGNANEAR